MSDTNPVPTDTIPINSKEALDAIFGQMHNRQDIPPETVTPPGQTASAADSVTLSESDIYNLPDIEEAPEVVRTFTINGKPTTITFSAKARYDAEAFIELGMLAAAKTDANGKPLPVSLKIQPPVGKPFTLTNLTYIGELKILAKVAPMYSFNGWAVLGRKIGPTGQRPGDDGIQHIVAAAMEINGLTSGATAEDEKGAGEGGSPADSPIA